VEDPRTLQANERTLLAWLRTGLALITFGFVIENKVTKKLAVLLSWRWRSIEERRRTFAEPSLGIGIRYLI